MKKIFLCFVLITFITVSGCSKANLDKKEQKNKVESSRITKSNKEKKETYNSITEYQEIINGKNFKTGVLSIELKDRSIFLSIDFLISSELKEIMMKTKNKFYFTLADIEGQEKLKNIFAENPNYIEGDIKKLSLGDKYHLSQIIKIKQNATPDEIKVALSPENYELAILNEKFELVAVIIGLELNMIQ
ncbi:hypothetical protein ACQYAD_00180 [Neobacillus sp. SM06]|uniref:hypothetical protein n=1 Tax=Neobacillus sp. SM06 TaxID=3422492 RepID=UPI003D2CC779